MTLDVDNHSFFYIKKITKYFMLDCATMPYGMVALASSVLKTNILIKRAQVYTDLDIYTISLNYISN